MKPEESKLEQGKSAVETPDRRQFLGASVGAACSLFATSHAAAGAQQQRRRSANDVIGIGIIGLGNIARSHIRNLKALKDQAEIVAVCDIYKPRLDWGMSVTGAKGYHDYHDLLADPRVDAVIIATPDHWHARMAIDAMRAGKDVDVEKPMSRTVEEAREMVRVAKETGRVLAVDSEHMAHGIWKPAWVAVQTNVIGKLIWSQTSRHRNQRAVPWSYRIDRDISPQNLDWERFLGDTPKVPFDPERFFRWRRYWEYSGGMATDLYFHHITPLIYVTGGEFPVRVVATGGHWFYSEQQMEVPDTFVMAADFDGGHTIMVGGSLANGQEMKIIVRGHEGNIVFHGPDQRRPAWLTLEPEEPFEEGVHARVQRADLAGEWIDKEQEQLKLEDLNPGLQKQYVAAALSRPEVREAYREAVQRNPAIETDPEQRLAFFSKVFAARSGQPKRKRVYRIVAFPGETFMENFLRCVRTRERPVLDGELGYRAQVAVGLAVQSYRRKKVMLFDPKTGRVSEA